MKVCHITTAHKLYDPRICLKETKSLAQNGYETYLIITAEKDTIWNNVKIIALKEAKDRFERFFKIKKEAFKKAVALKSNVYHLHDPELISVGLKIKRKTNAKIIFDVHEYISDQIMNKKWIKPNIVRKIVNKLYPLYERKLLKKYDGLIVAVPDLIRYYKYQHNIAVIRNFPILKIIEKIKPIKKNTNNKIIIYPGTLSLSRGMKIMLEVMLKLPDDYELWLFGTWHNYTEFEYCKELPGWKKTKYFGKKHPEDVYSFMKSADLGIQLLQPLNQYQKEDYPVKVFEFIAAGLPVLMSDFPHKKELFGKSVEYVDPQKPKEIANKIEKLISNPKVKDKLIEKGNKFIKDFSWEKEEDTLLEFYNSIIT